MLVTHIEPLEKRLEPLFIDAISEVELFLEDPRPISWSWRYLHCAAHRTAGQVAGHIAIGHGKRRAERRAAIFAQEDAIDRVLLMIVPWISWVAHA